MNKTERLLHQVHRDSTVYVELCNRKHFTTLDQMTWIMVDRAMVVAQGNVPKAAKLLGMGKATLYRYLREKGVGLGNYRETSVEREHSALRGLPLEEDERTC